MEKRPARCMLGNVPLRAIAMAIALSFARTTDAAAADADDEGQSSGSASAVSPPPLTVSLVAGTGGGPWKLKIENSGDVPIRIAADPRLLVLEVTPPAGFVDPATAAKAKARPASTSSKKPEEPKPVRCALPDDARPTTDEGRELVIPHGRSWTTVIDPLLYCFGTKERAVLLNGATVKARFGWAPKPAKPGGAASAKARAAQPAPLLPPFVAAPVGAAIGKVAPAKELESAPVTLSENANVIATTGANSPDDGKTATIPLAVTMAETQDVGRGAEISTSVTVTNDGDKPVVLRFHAGTMRFSVAGPAGSVACGTTRQAGSPIRELYSTIGVKGRASAAVLITAVCPADTFDEPGVYRVTPVLDTSGASARSIGLKTWDGVATGKTPMLLRVRSARRPGPPAVRPTLD